MHPHSTHHTVGNRIRCRPRSATGPAGPAVRTSPTRYPGSGSHNGGGAALSG